MAFCSKNSLDSIIKEMANEISVEQQTQYIPKVLVNKVNNSVSSSPKMLNKKSKRAINYESKKQKRKKKVFNKKKETNFQSHKRVGNNKKRLKVKRK